MTALTLIKQLLDLSAAKELPLNEIHIVTPFTPEVNDSYQVTIPRDPLLILDMDDGALTPLFWELDYSHVAIIPDPNSKK